ncbi:hypothetical protein Ancab_003861 [Ancistrocladus abbreviatus]
MVVRNLGIKMPDHRHFARINVLEIKAQIGKKLGPQKAQKYFNLLNRFFTRKVTKAEFDRLCIAAIGRDNVCLHNFLISSIIRNACLSKAPPPQERKVEDSVNGKVVNGYQRSCLQSLCRDVFPQSPRKGRTHGFRDRRFKDRPSPLGPHGKPHNVTVASEDLTPKVQEQQSATELLSLGSRPVEVNSVEDGEEVDQAAGSPGIHSRSPVTAPLGIPMNVKGPRKMLSAVSSPGTWMETCQRSGVLPDTHSLRNRMEQVLEQEALKVSTDCVNLLNNSLDAFLKRLIKPSLDLAASRLGNKLQNQAFVQAVPGPNGMQPVRYSKRSTPPVSASMLDLRTAMELNPSILGEDWPTQLEKVRLREYEEAWFGT